MTGKLFIGTSNVVLPVPRYAFPPEYQAMSRLGYYSTLFNSVEINSTFYKTPRGITLMRWTLETTKEFEFTLKLSRDITHKKPFVVNLPDIDNFLEVTQVMTAKQGCLLVQFPASITEDYFERVVAVLRRIRLRKRSDWKVAVEFRHDSWYADHVYRMLLSQKASLVLHDKRGSKTPALELPFRNMYLRFHGPQGDYRGTYSDEQLSVYALRVKKWLQQGKTVYAYFNNTMGTAFSDAQLLRTLCKD